MMEEAETNGMSSAAKLDFQWATEFLSEFHDMQTSAKPPGTLLSQQSAKWTVPGHERWKLIRTLQYMRVTWSRV